MSSFVLQDASTNVPGTIDELNDVFIFTPDNLPLVDDNYTVSFTASDIVGNSSPFTTTFTIDALLPAKPIITGGLIVSGLIQESPAQNISNTNTVLLTGTREDQTSLWLNDYPIQELGSGSWSTTLALTSGENTFEVWIEDAAGNRSASTWVDIWYEAGPVIQFEYDDSGKLNKNILIP